MKSFQNEFKSVMSGSNLGIITVPLINLITAIPAIITRNTTASPTDNADVYLKESVKHMQINHNEYSSWKANRNENKKKTWTL